ncbi:VSK-int [Pseudoalteromonas rubra]|uniref:VSK-int n=1 Tax=Pseudoalteromonas rubra TaxID=43658 RepID=A0A5S3WTI5_9GAMM|nr:DUF1293 family protein [Pseudoalteromonas rubra]TMP30186.1 VSK-int [Pseudoalteromonas rubra]TMP31945.1 VSK-int [Pseudoalteromonas rubra]
MAIVIAGIGITSFPQSKNPDVENAELEVLYPFESVDSPKFKRKSAGKTTDTPFNKKPIQINVAYAHLLIDTGAFVSDREYDLKFAFNSETFENEVVELIPVDADLKQHFKHSLGGHK